MAKLVITAGYLNLGGTDYSAQTSEARLTVNLETADSTSFGDSGWRTHIGGLKAGSLSVTFKKDSDLSGLDSAIWTEINSGDGIMTFEIRQDSGSVTASNPKYTGSIIVSEWQPVAGAVGELFQGSHTWQVTGAITRATS